MKKSISTVSIVSIIILIFTLSDSFSQAYDGSFYGFFFGRQPGARSEAMGRSFASVPGDVSSCYFNPAGSAVLNGLNLWGSYANPYYEFENGNFTGFGAAYSFKKYGVLGISGEVFSPNEYAGIPGNDTGAANTEAYNTGIANVRLTVSSEIAKDLYAGLNLNTFWPLEKYKHMSIGNSKGVLSDVIVYFDLGVMKSFTKTYNKNKHTLTIGLAFTNLNFAGYSVSDGDQREALPVIFRAGASYYTILYKKGITFLADIEYEDVLNSQDFEGIHTGIEFGLFDLLFLRAGYYSQDNRDCAECTERLNEFTYGAGLHLNLVPSGYRTWGIKFDYTNLRQPQLYTNRSEPERFSSFTALLYFIF